MTEHLKECPTSAKQIDKLRWHLLKLPGAESDVPLLEIVTALFSEWRRNGAKEDLTPQDVMAMQAQYRRVTRGKTVPHTHPAILNELADAMLCCIKARFHYDDSYILELRHKILRNLFENWPSIIRFDQNPARSLNVYPPPTFREQIQKALVHFEGNYTALQSSFSEFTCQLLLSIILLSWPLSLLIMGVMFTTHCPTDSSLPNAMVAVGTMGISAVLLRLVLLSVEEWYWFPMRIIISRLWNVMKLVEFVFLLALTAQLWLFFEDHASPNFRDPKSCNETFYSLLLWMNHTSTFFAVVWMVAYFVKAISWMMRIRYHYMPPFYAHTDMNTI
ncbi:uncharacterized protein LOC129983922 [Argiope bruennichi]|uniref:uncharacterized protein LOC129983922 n=1 Tax=Argiope bruennichi TaxID=94029 RepID=UPI0024949F1D|nr:uncharacterized protein LOC129983922 [Argiope bruennichi]